MMKAPPRILIAPLNWGLGHATRCIPVIRKLEELGAEAILAADGRAYDYLKAEFPGHQLIRLPGPEITYPEKMPMSLKMMFSAPAILREIQKERKMLKRIVTDYSIDAVISDNRYGLSSQRAYTVFITHQLNIKAPVALFFVEKLAAMIVRRYISRFDECWIPDFEGEANLSGDLSHSKSIPGSARYIGPLSRFYGLPENGESYKQEYDFTAIISGPEPQRSIFEEILFGQLKHSDLKGIIAGGKPESDKEFMLNPQIKVYSHIQGELLSKYMSQSGFIICRPGYSGIMDISSLGKKAILVPTPGQTEQEYLGRYFSERNIYVSCKQKNFDLKYAFKALESTTPIKTPFRPELLNQRLAKLLEVIDGNY